jgi:hypothetical protein
VEHKYYWLIESFKPFVELIQSIYFASGRQNSTVLIKLFILKIETMNVSSAMWQRLPWIYEATKSISILGYPCYLEDF